MRMRYIFPLLCILFISAACQPAEFEPALPTAVLEDTPATTATAMPTIENPTEDFQMPTPIPGTVALDFSERPCVASWSNNGEYLPCPGNLEEIINGYADRFDAITLAGNRHCNQPGLLIIPAQPESRFSAIFGKYPPFTVMPGDRFRAALACQNGYSQCDAQFSLEYFFNNQVLPIPGASWKKKAAPSGEILYADVSLDPLAGQTVQFLLAVRDNGDARDDHAIWIMPHIARIGAAAADAIPSHQLEVAIVQPVAISGTVDMRSAPPYLYDDHPPGSPAVVVFFDVNGDAFYSVSTRETHPNFSIAVYPGQYFVMAYAYGVGDVPYVSAAYTAADPSCGQSMAILNVRADTPVDGIVINDWNWSCGGNAHRIDKPPSVSLP